MVEKRLTEDAFVRNPELEKSSIGVVLLLVGIDPALNGDDASDPLLWTLIELDSKVGTDKRAGQLSVPAETRKIGEDNESTMLGALAEFCDDTSIDYMQQHLVTIDDAYKDKGIIVKENPADIAVVIYDGALDIPFVPVSKSEVLSNGWVHRSEIEVMEKSKVRTVLDSALKLDRVEGLISEALKIYHENPQKRRRVIPQGFSINNFSIRREIIDDIPLISYPQA